jgi:hypothetical protein
VPAPAIELLFWDGCPSHAATLAELRAALAELGADPDAVIVREVRTDGEAGDEGFVGSPTIRAGGRDLFPPGDEPTGLTCRIYRRRNGHVSPTPDPDDLRDALRAALEEQP